MQRSLKCGIQQKLSFSLYSCIWKRLLGSEKPPGTWTLLYEWKILKKEIACNGLVVVSMGCKE